MQVATSYIDNMRTSVQFLSSCYLFNRWPVLPVLAPSPPRSPQALLGWLKGLGRSQSPGIRSKASHSALASYSASLCRGILAIISPHYGMANYRYYTPPPRRGHEDDSYPASPSRTYHPNQLPNANPPAYHASSYSYSGAGSFATSSERETNVASRAGDEISLEPLRREPTRSLREDLRRPRTTGGRIAMITACWICILFPVIAATCAASLPAFAFIASAKAGLLPGIVVSRALLFIAALEGGVILGLVCGLATCAYWTAVRWRDGVFDWPTSPADALKDIVPRSYWLLLAKVVIIFIPGTWAIPVGLAIQPKSEVVAGSYGTVVGATAGIFLYLACVIGIGCLLLSFFFCGVVCG